MLTEKFKSQMPPSVLPALAKLPADQQGSFVDEYNRQKKSLLLGVVLVLLVPGFHFYQLGFSFGRFIVSALFLGTCGGLFVWWLAEFFLHRRRIKAFNQALAVGILKDIKLLNAG